MYRTHGVSHIGLVQTLRYHVAFWKVMHCMSIYLILRDVDQSIQQCSQETSRLLLLLRTSFLIARYKCFVALMMVLSNCWKRMTARALLPLLEMYSKWWKIFHGTLMNKKVNICTSLYFTVHEWICSATPIDCLKDSSVDFYSSRDAFPIMSVERDEETLNL